MANDAEEIEYKVWASDNMVYGPVNLDILLDWVADGRVTPDTWVSVSYTHLTLPTTPYV